MERISEQISYIRRLIGDVRRIDVPDDQDILDLLKAAQKDIARKAKCFEDIHSAVTVADQEAYVSPANYCMHKGVCRVGNYPLDYKRKLYFDKFQEDDYDDSDSEQKFFWIERGYFGLKPIPSASGAAILLPYYKYPTNLILYPLKGLPGLETNVDPGNVDVGEHNYKITFYDSINDIESEAYYIGKATVVTDTSVITLGDTSSTGAVLPISYDKDVDRINIYRTIANASKVLGPYYYVAYVANGVNYYHDNIADATIQENDELSDELGFYDVPEGYDRETYGLTMCHYCLWKLFYEDEEYTRARLFEAKYLGKDEFENEGINDLKKYLGDHRHYGQTVRYREF